MTRLHAGGYMAKRNKGGVHPAADRTSSRVFHALASDPRRMMLIHLSASTLTAGEIAARFEMAKPSISQHLSILENAELIEGVKRGQYIHYSLKPDALRHALQAMMTAIEASSEASGDNPVASPETARPKKVEKQKKGASEPSPSAEKPAKAKSAVKKPATEKPGKPGADLPPAPQQMGLLDLLGMDG